VFWLGSYGLHGQNTDKSFARCLFLLARQWNNAVRESGKRVIRLLRHKAMIGSPQTVVPPPGSFFSRKKLLSLQRKLASLAGAVIACYPFRPNRRASCLSTSFVNTPLQVNLAPSLIKSSKVFSPSWLIQVTFRRSTTSMRPSSSARCPLHVLRSSAIQGAISLPSITNLRRFRFSTIEILIVNITHDGGALSLAE
jgi:hypothetical protein